MYADDNNGLIPRGNEPYWWQVYIPNLGGTAANRDQYGRIKVYTCPSYPDKRQVMCYVVNAWQFSSPRDRIGTDLNGLYKVTRIQVPTETIYFADNENGSWRPIFTATRIIGDINLNDVWSPTHLPYPSTSATARLSAITGETGTGKEVVAEMIHRLSPRAGGPFVAVNMAAIPPDLFESEMFGHVKGSFTGAYRDKPGKLETAHTGTIFLDEVGEMTLRMQGLLLRFLETGELQKVGADGGSRHVDVRVVAATNRNLRDLIAQGQFRDDLYYRLNVIHIIVPPLRDRRDDIPELVDHFLGRYTAANRSAITAVSPAALKALSAHSWPGNVRELENVIERLVVNAKGTQIEFDDLSPDVKAQDAISFKPRRERRRTVADDLYKRLTEERESFWTAVYPLFMEREITRANVREVVKKGLEEARGNYKIVARLFNMESRDYKRFLNFLRKHDCQIPFKEYR
jgi:DNA-binding NtrC family response regulator